MCVLKAVHIVTFNNARRALTFARSDYVFCCVLPFLISAFFYLWLPTTLPMHYNGAGEINRWGKSSEIVMLGIILSAIPSHLPIFIRYYKPAKAQSVKEWKIVLYAMIIMALTYTITSVFFCMKA